MDTCEDRTSVPYIYRFCHFEDPVTKFSKCPKYIVKLVRSSKSKSSSKVQRIVFSGSALESAATATATGAHVRSRVGVDAVVIRDAFVARRGHVHVADVHVVAGVRMHGLQPRTHRATLSSRLQPQHDSPHNSNAHSNESFY